MRDKMQQVDNSLMLKTPERSYHNLDSETKTTLRFGQLTPIFCQEIAPGDKINISNEVLTRFQPLVSPLMHKVEVLTHYYYVPFRLLWHNWENFITGRKDRVTGQEPIHPFFNRGSLLNDLDTNTTLPRLAGYFGFKPRRSNPNGDPVLLSPMSFAAYQLIWNHYYRHKAVQEEVEFELNDGSLIGTRFNELTKMRNITFKDDYFNSALPTPQKGEPIFIDADAQLFTTTQGGLDIITNVGDIPIAGRSANPNDVVEQDSLYANAKIIVEEIRRAAALQKIVEAQNHAQSYQDYLKVFHNVDLPDHRASMPEYITGSRQPIIISDVMNTADQNQGRITGNGTGYSRSDQGSHYCFEHGLVIGLAAVVYKPTYVNALPRVHTKLSRYEYFDPMTDGMGEQAIKRIEIASDSDNPDEIFGYVPRNYDYRSSFDLCTGEMQSLYMHYHMARNLGQNPRLTSDFYDVVDERRNFVFQQHTHDPIMLQVYNNVGVSRNIAALPEPIL